MYKVPKNSNPSAEKCTSFVQEPVCAIKKREENIVFLSILSNIISLVVEQNCWYEQYADKEPLDIRLTKSLDIPYKYDWVE